MQCVDLVSENKDQKTVKRRKNRKKLYEKAKKARPDAPLTTIFLLDHSGKRSLLVRHMSRQTGRGRGV